MQTQNRARLTNDISQILTDQAARSRLDRLYVVKTLSLILTISAAGTSVASFWACLASGSSLMVGVAWLVAAAIFFTSYLVARFGKHPNIADFTVCLQVIGIQAAVTLVHLQPKPGSGVLVLMLIVPVLVGVLDFKGIYRYIFNLCSALLMTGLYISDESIRLADPKAQPNSFDVSGLAYLILAYLVVTPIVAVFVRRQNQATQLAAAQASQLKELVQALASTTEFGANISRDIAGVTTQLSATSHQQASTGQQLAAAITQVTSSLEELSQTASQIAGVANSTNHTTNQAVLVATEVKENSKLASESGLEGRQSVEQANHSVEQARERIELLGQRLLYLTNLSSRASTIVELIDEIADETHLLALNASIEAAGTGGTSGERFTVIAGEVRNLSERSRESTQEVRQAIQEIQGAVAAAVLVAEEGKKDTSLALSRSKLAGMVIDKLNQVIDDNAKQAEEILLAAQEIQHRAEEINLATGQQRSASEQILVTMRQINEASQQAVGSVSHLSDMAVEVNQQIDGLNILLAKSNQSLEPVFAGL